MTAEESLREGKLDDALASLQDQVRKDPADPKHRTFLFQLLSVLGQWDRALNQLKVAGEMDAQAIPMVQTYRDALACEVLRNEVFDGKRSPLVFGEPQEWVALMIEAVRVQAQGKHAEAASLRERALEDAPATSGTLNETPFEWIADADSRLGPILETILLGKYYWIPFQNIASIEIEAPEDLRDLVWTPAHLTWANGGESVALIPTRYVGSAQDERGEVRLSRRTEWVELGEGAYAGLGQRLLATDQAETPLLEVRKVTLDTAVEPDGEGPADSDG